MEGGSNVAGGMAAGERAGREAEGVALEAELARACGAVNAATGAMVEVLARVLAAGVWQVGGIHSPEQWVAWQCGVSPRRAATLVALANRAGELPTTAAALCAGELSEDQVAVVCRHAPATVDAQVAELARHATVAQLRRALGRYRFASGGPEVGSDPPAAETAAASPPPPEEVRRVGFGFTEAGGWRLSASLAPDEGAAFEAALGAARARLVADGASGATVSWADALVELARNSPAADAPARDAALVWLHVRADGGGHLHLGPGIASGLQRYLSCDARVVPVVEAEGRPLSVGRALRSVPDRTRMAVEDRDGGCRVPGCGRRRGLHVHHIRHWEQGGPTDTANLVALCPFHHRLHHRGRLGIVGDADRPGGMTFTDERGGRLVACGTPLPPGGRPPPTGRWVHPTGERVDTWAVHFDEPAPMPG